MRRAKIDTGTNRVTLTPHWTDKTVTATEVIYRTYWTHPDPNDPEIAVLRITEQRQKKG